MSFYESKLVPRALQYKQKTQIHVARNLKTTSFDLGKLTIPANENELKKKIGNAMPVNVLQRLFCRLLPCAGLADALPGPRGDGRRPGTPSTQYRPSPA